MDSRGLAPRSLARDASIFLLDDEPFLRSGSRETRTHKRRFVATCFQNRLLIQPDDFRPLSCGSWNRTNGLLRPTYRSVPGVRRRYQQQLFRIDMTYERHSLVARVHELGEKDSNLHNLLQRQAAYR